MQFCKFISYKLTAFNIIYNYIAVCLCRNTLKVPFRLVTLMKMPGTRVHLKPIIPILKDNDKKSSLHMWVE